MNQQKKSSMKAPPLIETLNFLLKKIRDYFMLLFSCMSQWIYFHVMIFDMKHMRTFSYFFSSSYSHMTYFFTHSLALIIHVTRRQFFLIVSQLISTLTIFFVVLYFHLSVCLLSFRLHAIKINKNSVSCCIDNERNGREIRNFND